jgi:hypothetical protein
MINLLAVGTNAMGLVLEAEIPMSNVNAQRVIG